MNVVELQKKLLAAARANRPDEHVPYAFEKRVMARLGEKPALDGLALWNRTLWRAAAPCVALTLLLGVWTLFAPADENPGETLAADLETTLYAPFESQTELQ
jgi:transposase